MKKVVVATLLALASTATMSHYAVGQAAAPAAGATSDVQLPPAEANDYNNAEGQTTPAAKAQALEAFLTKYPDTKVKVYALQDLLQTYTQSDPTKIVPTADRLLQADPNNVRALTMEVYFRKNAADQSPDATQKQSGLDDAAGFAQKGLAAIQTKPAGMSDDDFNKMKVLAVPMFYSAIGEDALGKKDGAAAIDAYKKELASVPVDQTQTPGMELTDTFLLGQAYVLASPKDLVDCSFYVARAVDFAPDQFKTLFQPTLNYCYRTFHGNLDGLDAVETAAKTNLNPPADFKIEPAPKPSDLAHQALAGVDDPSKLALGDREYILANGVKDDADKVWASMNGKSISIPDATVIAATPGANGGAPTQIQVAVSDDAVQTKTADYTVNLKPIEAPEEPKAKTAAALAAYKKKKADYDALVAATAVGAKVTFDATYASYVTTPTIMITMNDAEIELPKAAAPAHHAAPAAHHAAH